MSKEKIEILTAKFKSSTNAHDTRAMEDIIYTLISNQELLKEKKPFSSKKVLSHDNKNVIIIDVLGETRHFITIKNKGITVLDWAVKKGHLDSVKYLLTTMSKKRSLSLIQKALISAISLRKTHIIRFLFT